jgi:hypothetical protein
MNITDFVDSIKLQLSDFMKIGEVGFVEGISNTCKIFDCKKSSLKRLIHKYKTF